MASDVWFYVSGTKRKYMIILEILCIFGVYITSLCLLYSLTNNNSTCNMNQYNGLICLSIQISVYILIIVTCSILICFICLCIYWICIGIYCLFKIFYQLIDNNNDATDINKLNTMKTLTPDNLISYHRPKSLTKCVICHLKAKDDLGIKWSILLCGHKFHTQCIKRFAKSTTLCPICIPVSNAVIDPNPINIV